MPHSKAEVPSGRPQSRAGRGRQGSAFRAGVWAAGRPPASGPHQQLSFFTLCSSEALARDRTIWRVSFMAMGGRDPSHQARPWTCPLSWRIGLRCGASPGGGARVVRGGSCESIGLQVRGRGRVGAVESSSRAPWAQCLVLRRRGVGTRGSDVILWGRELATLLHPRVPAPSPELKPRPLIPPT